MKRLRRYKVPVKPYSHSRSDFNGIHRDKSSGKRGMLFAVRRITWLDSNHVQVNAGYHQDADASLEANFLMELRQGRWTVVRMKEPIVVSQRPEVSSRRLQSNRAA